MIKEKRAHKRIAVKIVGNCLWHSQESSFLGHDICYTKNITSHGARLVSSREIEPGDIFTVKLEIPTFLIPVSIHSEVVWAQAMAVWSDKIHAFTEAGIKFLSLEPLDREKLKSFLKSHKQNSLRSKVSP